MNPEWWIDPGQLDTDQLAVMRLPLEGDFLILGPPGSGKTNLLLLRANYVAQAGFPNILIVVFGRTLREFIVRGSALYRYDPERVKTSTACFLDLLKQYGHNRPADELSFDQVRLELVERVRALRASLPNPPFDAIFLDEAQDFLPEEVEIFTQLGNRIFAVADPKQKVYSGQPGLDVLRKRCTETVLSHHYRNGQTICRIADALGKGMPSYDVMLPKSHYDEARLPSTVRADSLCFEDQVREIVSRLNVQIKAFPGELFGVLCPRRIDVDQMYDALCNAGLEANLEKQAFESGYVALEPGTQVCVSTIHGCKGLEFRAVHAAMLDSLRKFPLQRNLVFTLATRAKTSLSLYGNPLPAFLQSALLIVDPLPALPSIDIAFGGGSE